MLEKKKLKEAAKRIVLAANGEKMRIDRTFSNYIK